jgi:hypothetical protein
MPHQDAFIWILIVGAVFGLTAYFLSRLCLWTPPTTVAALEAGACGAGILAGIHLCIGSVCPDIITHIIGPEGDVVNRSQIFFKVDNVYTHVPFSICFGEFHCLHIFLGGVATAMIAAGGLIKFCRDRQRPLPPTPDAH